MAVGQYFDDRHSLISSNIASIRESIDIRLNNLRRDGSGSNYVQRFNFLKRVFDAEFIEIYRRAKSVSVGLRSVYEIDLAVPAIQRVGYLNEMVSWSKRAYSILERKLLMTGTATVVIPVRRGVDTNVLSGLLTSADYITQRAAGAFRFNLPATFFEGATSTFRNPRLRGVDLCAWTAASPKVLDYARVRVELPDQSIRADGLSIWAQRPVIMMSSITFPQGPMIEVPARRAVHNANPVGDWEIQIDSRTITGAETNKDEFLQNIFLVMRIAHEVIN